MPPRRPSSAQRGRLSLVPKHDEGRSLHTHLPPAPPGKPETTPFAGWSHLPPSQARAHPERAAACTPPATPSPPGPAGTSLCGGALLAAARSGTDFSFQSLRPRLLLPAPETVSWGLSSPRSWMGRRVGTSAYKRQEKRGEQHSSQAGPQRPLGASGAEEPPRCPPGDHGPLTTEAAAVHVWLQPGDQRVDVGVVELETLQEGDGPVLPSRPQQVQQVSLGDRKVLANGGRAGPPRGAVGGGPRASGNQGSAPPGSPGSRGGVRLKRDEADLYRATTGSRAPRAGDQKLRTMTGALGPACASRARGGQEAESSTQGRATQAPCCQRGAGAGVHVSCAGVSAAAPWQLSEAWALG